MIETESHDPRVARSRARILAAAGDCFLAEGYAGTTVEGIAQHAGMGRRTVFNVFADKQSLFRASILSSIGIAESFITVLSDGMTDVDAVAELPDLAVRLARAVLIGPVIGLRRLLAAESESFPDLVEEYWRRAPGAVMVALAALLARLDAESALRVPDPVVAARHFAYLVLGESLDRRMLGLDVEAPTLHDVERDALLGAEAFLRAYAR